MGCMCKEISRCIFDIAEIETISLIVRFTEKTNDSVSTELSNLASKGLSTFYSANEDELMTKEKKLNDDLTKELTRLLDKCSDKIEELERKLSMMQADDSAFHSEEEHHHHGD